jgi:hypothetical protein
MLHLYAPSFTPATDSIQPIAGLVPNSPETMLAIPFTVSISLKFLGSPFSSYISPASLIHSIHDKPSNIVLKRKVNIAGKSASLNECFKSN